MSHPGWDASPSQGYVIPSIEFAGTHLYTWVERDTVSVMYITHLTPDKLSFQELKLVPFFSDPLREQSLLPLLSGITDDTTFLPLPTGKTYSLLALAIDHVGNRQPMDLNRVIKVDFTPPKRRSWC